MKINYILAGLMAVIISSSVSTSSSSAQDNAGFSVESASFKNGDTLSNSQVFKGFGCQGSNLSPQLSWKNAPEGTKSFAITMYDPDAPTGSGWWHWGVANIPADTTSIDEGASKTGKNTLPQGSVEIFTDFGNTGYGGPCPPVGDIAHRYIITVYAVKVENLDLNPNTTTGALLAFTLRENSLAKAVITGKYGR